MRRILRSSVPRRSAGQSGDASVIRASSAGGSRRDRLRERAGEVVRLALEQRGQLLPGEIPLVEEEERLAARRLPARRTAHARASDGQPTLEVGERGRRVLAASELVARRARRGRARASSGCPRRRARAAHVRRGRSPRPACRRPRSPWRSSSRSRAGSPRRTQTAVSTRTPGPSGGTKRVTVPGAGQKAARRILRVDADLEGVPATCVARPVAASGSPAAIRICSRTMSIPVTSSVTGCSTCSRQLTSMK